MPNDVRRYRTTYRGFTIEELSPDGSRTVIHEEKGCVWDNAPAYVHLSLQEKETAMRGELRKLAEAQEETRKRKNQ